MIFFFLNQDMLFYSYTKHIFRKTSHLGNIVKIRNILNESKVEKWLHGSVTKMKKLKQTVADGMEEQEDK